jgi:hypothetical protein
MHDPASSLLNERWIRLLSVRCAHPQLSLLFPIHTERDLQEGRNL